MTTEEILLAKRLREFCSPGNIALVLKALCERVPEVLPDYNRWTIGDPIPRICAAISAEGYVEGMLPVLRSVLNDNISNVQWSARVLIGITVFKIITE